MMTRDHIPRARRWLSVEGYQLWLTYYQMGLASLNTVYDNRMKTETFDPLVKVRQLCDGWLSERIMTDSFDRVRHFNPSQIGVFGSANPEPDLIDLNGKTYEVKATPSKLHLKRTGCDYYLIWKYGNRIAKKVRADNIWKDGKTQFKTEMWNGHLAAVISDDELMTIGTCLEVNSPLAFFENGA